MKRYESNKTRLGYCFVVLLVYPQARANTDLGGVMCHWQQLVLLLSFFCLASAQTTVCGNGGFDIDPLIK